jgi:hypothetical protein
VILGANRNRDAGDGQQGNQGGGDRRDRGDPGGGDRNPGGRGPFGGRGLFGGFEFFSGWGFGNIVFDDSRQGYCWAGKAVAATTFEIAVKTGELTKEETKLLVR